MKIQCITDDGRKFDNEPDARIWEQRLAWANAYLAEHGQFTTDVRRENAARRLALGIEVWDAERDAGLVDGSVDAMRAGVDSLAAARRGPPDAPDAEPDETPEDNEALPIAAETRAA